ncbi:MAG: hypothetical protein QXY37_02900 [Metallosphaera sp.]
MVSQAVELARDIRQSVDSAEEILTDIQEDGLDFAQIKLEIEAMASKGLKFLAFQYIPEKIQTKDFIS